MNILVSLTYYRPHVSGLTIYVERLARALVRRGHDVTVLTSQYDKRLQREERMDGVLVVRVPVLARVSKGVLMPTIGLVASKLVAQHDVVSLHLPQLDASGIALRAKLLRKPIILTYHSDLILPKSAINFLASSVVDISNMMAGYLSDVICAYTDDFARHSRFLSKYLDKVNCILPPVEVRQTTKQERARWALDQGVAEKRPIIGVGVRLAAEKGIEYLLQALPTILDKYPDAVVLHVGPTERVIGEQRYRRWLQPMLEPFREHYKFLGALSPDEMGLFFGNCDVHVLPSINSTETFGLVQIEAAMCGTPSVATELPGVRVATRMTGMGVSVPPRDSLALAGAILSVLSDRPTNKYRREALEREFSPDVAAARYEHLFRDLLIRNSKNKVG